MTDDIRKILYEKYVQTLKGAQLNISERKKAQLHDKYGAWYFKHLNGLAHGASILELGCGPGFFLEYMMARGYNKIEGLDISDEQLKIAQSLGVKTHQGDVFDFLQHKRNHYDAVIALDFVEHFTKGQLLELFDSIYKSLKTGGLLLLQTPNGQGLFPGQNIYGDLTHMTILCESSLTQILKLNGFSQFKFFETAPVPKGLGGRLNLFLWNIIRFMIRMVRQIECKNNSKIWTENIICICKKEK